MSICSHCHKSQISIKHDVGHWWNNPEDSVYVCSDECYDELEKLVQTRTWMEHRPPAMFGRKREEPSPNFGPSALTDKQFGEE